MRVLVAPVTIILVVALAVPIHASDPIEDLGEALGDVVAGILWGLFDLQLCIRIRLAIDFSSEVTRCCIGCQPSFSVGSRKGTPLL